MCKEEIIPVIDELNDKLREAGCIPEDLQTKGGHYISIENITKNSYKEGCNAHT